MDLISLTNSIAEAVVNIDAGRKSWAIKGKAEEGRISYETGIAMASFAFEEAQVSADPLTIILAEYTFVSQEIQFYDDAEKTTLSSLTNAKERFDDAFLALQIVENSALYKGAEKTYPHYKDYRTCGFPRDAFHFACNSHKTRLQNIERSPGIDRLEKVLLNLRIANLAAAQSGYIEKQRKALDS